MHPYGSVVRSLLVGILELGVEEVMVIGHTDCGVQGMDGNEMLEKLVERGIDQQHIDIVRHSGIDLERWLGGFESVESSVHETVRRLKEHPLMPKDVRISGFIMDSVTGELTSDFRGRIGGFALFLYRKQCYTVRDKAICIWRVFGRILRIRNRTKGEISCLYLILMMNQIKNSHGEMYIYQCYFPMTS